LLAFFILAIRHIIENEINEKIKALIETRILPANGIVPSPKTTARAAPKPAAADMPSVYGLARGLSRIVCTSAPATARDAPTIIAIRALGNLKSQTMMFVLGLFKCGEIIVEKTS